MDQFGLVEPVDRLGQGVAVALIFDAEFTSLDFTSMLSKRGIKISMDGRGSWRDNVFVKRL